MVGTSPDVWLVIVDPDMVAFLTLFLGLVTGVQPVQVTVGPEVATVELRLDGESVGILQAAPWTLPVDLGSELAPHRLEAVAFDAEGRRVGRVSQTLNLPRPPVELRLAVDTSREPVVARMLWRSVLGLEPAQVRLWLDGEPVAVEDPAAVELPAHDPAGLHFLRAELVLEDGSRSHDELVFGAASDRVHQELTAVPVRFAQDRERAPGDLSGLFEAGGRSLSPVAVESGPADVLVVLDPGARDALRRIGAVLQRGGSNLDPRTAGSFRSPLFRLATLPRDTTLRLLWPQPRRRAAADEALDFDVFPMTEETTFDAGGIYWQVAAVSHGWPVAREIRRADAVAVAASRAAARNRPRAVVALVSEALEDSSELGPGQVERYLARLGVPLHVWSLAPQGSRLEPGDGGFSVAETVSTVRGLTRAGKALQRDLDHQRIVWVEGRWLPQEIRVGEAAGVGRVVALPQPPEASAAPLAGPGPSEVTGRDRVVGFLTALEPVETSDEEAADVPRDFRWDRARRLLGRPPGEVDRIGPWPALTDLDDGELREQLGGVAERIGRAYEERFGREPGEAVEGGEGVILFARESDYRTFEELGDGTPGLGLEGHAGGGLAVLFRGERPDDELAALLVHELTHLLHERAFGDRLPPWLEEGMAEDLALSRVTPEGEIELGSLGGVATVERRSSLGAERVRVTGGTALLGRLARSLAEGRLLGLERVLTLSRGAFAQPEGRALRYAVSAFFVRFLLDRHGEEFRAFLQTVALLRPASVRTLTDHLGQGLDELERRFHAWLRAEALRAGFR